MSNSTQNGWEREDKVIEVKIKVKRRGLFHPNCGLYSGSPAEFNSCSCQRASEVSMYECSLCSYQSPTKSQIKQHLSIKHKNI